MDPNQQNRKVMNRSFGEEFHNNLVPEIILVLWKNLSEEEDLAIKVAMETK